MSITKPAMAIFLFFRISFSVSGKRLRELKVGDEDPAKVRFNAGSLAVSGDAIEVVDARNVTSLRSNVSLLSCPRLKRALFSGTNVPTLYIPRGAKITEVEFPSGLQTLFLHTLPLLQESGMVIPDAALQTITGLYYYQCPGISPFGILRRIYQTEGNRLQFLTMIWTDEIDGTSEDLDMLAVFAGKSYDTEAGEGYGCVEYDADTNLLSNSSRHPDLQGVINIAGSAYEDSVNSLREYFGSALTLNIMGAYYVRFADPVWGAYAAARWGDGTGTTKAQMISVKSLSSSDRNVSCDVMDVRWCVISDGCGFYPKKRSSPSLLFGKTKRVLLSQSDGDSLREEYDRVIGYSTDYLYIYGWNYNHLNINVLAFRKVTTLAEDGGGGTEVFRGTKLTIGKLYIGNTVPPPVVSDIRKVAQIYVPQDSVTAYQDASIWNTVADRIVGYDFIGDPDGIFTLIDAVWNIDGTMKE